MLYKTNVSLIFLTYVLARLELSTGTIGKIYNRNHLSFILWIVAFNRLTYYGVKFYINTLLRSTETASLYSSYMVCREHNLIELVLLDSKAEIYLTYNICYVLSGKVYIKRTTVMQLGSTFICNCNIALHISDAFCSHLQEHLEIVVAASGEWHKTGRCIHLTQSHVTHHRLLLQFLSAPEDGRKKRPKHVEQYCSYK